MMNTNYCVVYCTYPDKETADKIAKELLDKRLVACINVIPGLTSHYIWKGDLEKGDECLLVMKTQQDKLQSLEQAILESHPYDFPEFIAMPIIYGNKQYLDWVTEVVA